MEEKSGEAVFDLETQQAIFGEVNGRNTHLLRVSVAGIYLYEKNKFEVFTENQISQLLPILESASLIIGFNIRRFDYLVLERYFKRNLNSLPTLDILEEVDRTLGHRLKLDNIVIATLGEGKTGTGLDAIRYFQEGKMEKLIEYCVNDVRLTRDLYEYGEKYGLTYFMKVNLVMRQYQ